MQDSSWAERLELVGDDDRLVGSAGALPLRLLAERTGLRAGLSAAMTRRGFTPVYDRGQLLVDLAVTQLLGGEAISDFQGLRHLAPVIGPVPSNPTVWRALNEVGQLQLSRINTAVTVFRRHWWRLLAARPEGFPWLKVAGRELTGITVVDLDASIVFACSDKQNAAPTYKGGIGFCPNLASCDNTDDVLVIDPRPGNAESWPIPISILLALPLGVIGGVVASTMRGLPNDVYFQIGLLTTLGLTTKNAILIVQFAKDRVNEGMGLIEATLEASKLRLRPIVMTSLAFGFGVMPLAFASGAGAGAQKAIGTAVLGGVVTSTFLVTVFAPLFFVLIQSTLGKRTPQPVASVEPDASGTH